MFGAGSWAKIWEIKAINEKYSDIRISTSKKDKDGNYVQDFGGYVRMVGKAHSQMSYLSEGDRFKIERCGVENHYDKAKKITYYNFVIFEIEAEESEGAPTVPEASDTEDNPFL